MLVAMWKGGGGGGNWRLRYVLCASCFHRYHILAASSDYCYMQSLTNIKAFNF